MKLTHPTRLLLSVMLIFTSNAFYTGARADEYSDVSQLVRSGKYPEALSKADQFLSAQPKDAQMRFLKGVIQRESGKTSDSISTFTRLTEDYPELPEPYNNLAVLYAGQGQYDKARTALEMAIRTNPSYSTAHENLGDVYAKLASQAYNKALQLDTSNAAVVPKLALIRELFSPVGAKTQRPSALAPVEPPPQIASMTPGKNIPSLPQPPAPKQAPSIGGSAPSTNPSTSVSSSTTTASAQATQVPAPAPVAAVAAAAPAAPATATAAPTVSTSSTASSAGAASSTSTAASMSSKEVEAVVKAWASAWSAKDVKTYLGLYGKDFSPPSGMSRSNWEEERRQRITGKTTISVKLDGLSVAVSGSKATAKFRQDYKANGLAVSSRKSLELVKTGDHWKIVKESVGS